MSFGIDVNRILSVAEIQGWRGNKFYGYEHKRFHGQVYRRVRRGDKIIEDWERLVDFYTGEPFNLVVDVGETQMAKRLGGISSNPISHMAVGTGTTAAAEGDTALETEIARVAATCSVAGSVLTVAATYGAGVGTGAHTEIGCFDAASAGVMTNRLVFAAKNKGASDIFDYEIKFTFE